MKLKLCYTVSFAVEISSYEQVLEDYGLPADTTLEDFKTIHLKMYADGDMYIEDTIDGRIANSTAIMLDIRKVE